MKKEYAKPLAALIKIETGAALLSGSGAQINPGDGSGTIVEKEDGGDWAG